MIASIETFPSPAERAGLPQKPSIASPAAVNQTNTTSNTNDSAPSFSAVIQEMAAAAAAAGTTVASIAGKSTSGAAAPASGATTTSSTTASSTTASVKTGSPSTTNTITSSDTNNSAPSFSAVIQEMAAAAAAAGTTVASKVGQSTSSAAAPASTVTTAGATTTKTTATTTTTSSAATTSSTATSTPTAKYPEPNFGANPWMSGPTGTGPNGMVTYYNPVYFATQQTAQSVAQMLGGTVVQSAQMASSPNSPFQQNQLNYMVQLPSGGLVNPGLIADIYMHGWSQSLIDQQVQNEVNNAEPAAQTLST